MEIKEITDFLNFDLNTILSKVLTYIKEIKKTMKPSDFLSTLQTLSSYSYKATLGLNNLDEYINTTKRIAELERDARINPSGYSLIDELIKEREEEEPIKEPQSKITAEKTIKQIIDEAKKDPNYDVQESVITLFDKEINQKLLSLKVEPAQFIYLSNIIHPFKQELSESDIFYLNYLMQVEGWEKEELDYISGNKLTAFQPNPDIFPEDEEDYRQIIPIENYLASIKHILELENDKASENKKIIISMNASSFNLKIKKKLVYISHQLPVEKFLKEFALPMGFLQKYEIGEL